MTIDSAVYSAVEADSLSTPPKDSVVAIPLAADGSKGKAPAAWVPTLYFAEGLPNYLVTILSLYMFLTSLSSLGPAGKGIAAANNAHWVRGRPRRSPQDRRRPPRTP